MAGKAMEGGREGRPWDEVTCVTPERRGCTLWKQEEERSRQEATSAETLRGVSCGV